MHYYVHLSVQQQRMSDLAQRYLQSVEERGDRTGGRSVETEVRRSLLTILALSVSATIIAGWIIKKSLTLHI